METDPQSPETPKEPAKPRKKQNIWPFAVIGMALLLAIIFFLLASGGNVEEGPITLEAPPEELGTGGNELPEDTGQAAPAVPSYTLSYEKALKEYSKTRIQFSETCQATPSAMTVKNKTKIMLDNRSKEARWIIIDGRKHYINAYDFQIITLTSQILPYSMQIDCGESPNVAQINVQP